MSRETIHACAATSETIAATAPPGVDRQTARAAVRAFWRGDETPDWLDARLPTVVASQDDGAACKLVLELADGARIESVLLDMGRRTHLCVSSQVGCRLACSFCETGRAGLGRNLTGLEIAAQVAIARHRLGRLSDHVVFMGMGEPLDNPTGLAAALAVLLDRNGPAYAQERLTVCTVGHLPGLEAVAGWPWPRLNLAFSLHSADQAVRERLVPSARRWPLEALRTHLAVHRPRANYRLAINYCLLPGINDRPCDPALVADFCAGLGRVLVNVIPYNPGSSVIAPVPAPEAVAGFVTALRAQGVAARQRLSKGRAVRAACGQLAPAPAPARSGATTA